MSRRRALPAARRSSRVGLSGLRGSMGRLYPRLQRCEGEQLDPPYPCPTAGYTRIEMADAELMVWIDQGLCTGDGICSEIAPDVFQERSDGVWVVKEIASHWGQDLVFDGEQAPDGSRGVARVPAAVLDEVVESAEECPGECIMIEPFDQATFDKRT